VGGDDFGERLPWARDLKRMLDDGAQRIVIDFSEERLELEAMA
jgi:hypothetical protein